MVVVKKVMYEKCKQDKKTCFAYMEEEGTGYGYCKILSNTQFNRDCPFFKTKQDIIEQKQRLEEQQK